MVKTVVSITKCDDYQYDLVQKKMSSMLILKV